jgi:hypothetical protein
MKAATSDVTLEVVEFTTKYNSGSVSIGGSIYVLVSKVIKPIRVHDFVHEHLESTDQDIFEACLNIVCVVVILHLKSISTCIRLLGHSDDRTKEV